MSDSAALARPPRSGGAAGPGSARRRRRVRGDHGSAPVDGAVPERHQLDHRPRPGEHQPGVRRRPAVLGPDPAGRRPDRRPLRRRPGAAARPRPRLPRHRARAADDDDLRPDRRHRRPRCRRCRLRRAVGAALGDGAPRAAGKARHRQRHRQCRRLVRPVHLRADRPGHHGRRRLGDRDPEHGGDRAAGAAGGVGAARQLGAGGQRCRGCGQCDASAPAKRESAREAIRRAMHDPSYLLLARGVLRLRLSRRLHRHPSARRRRRVPAAAFGGRVGAGDRRPVQHRRQLLDRLGDRPLAHEVAALADLCGARHRRCWSSCWRRRPRRWC